MPNAPTIYTVGHSNKTGAELMALLVEHEIDTLVDVRTKPSSRWPDFNQAALRKSVIYAGMKYEHRGANLGGLGRNVKFAESLDEMVERAAAGEKIALMCSEGDYKNCHRGDTLTNPLLERGADIIHISWKGTDVTQRASEGPALPKVPPAPKHEPLFDWDIPTVVRGREPKWVTP